MELREAARRIVLQHWLLIACLVVVGVAIGAIHGHRPPEYTASTRLVIGADDPKSRTESGSIADTAKAIATSPTQVRRALEDAKIDRNPNAVASGHVSVSALGTSGVVQLSVSDKDPDAAQAIANALAGRVIRVRTDVVNGQVEQVLEQQPCPTGRGTPAARPPRPAALFTRVRTDQRALGRRTASQAFGHQRGECADAD
jgi:capsular polysaccharide biosynthesis protein